MTDKFSNIFKSALITGLLSLLPIGILFAFLVWLYRIVSGIISPIGSLIPISSGFVVTILTLIIIVVFTFLVGIVLRTPFGSYLFKFIEDSFFNLLPGYKTIKKTISPFTKANRKNAFMSVALVNLFENGTLATAFIIERHPHDRTTVFIPTGPNPTSGNIYHVKNEFVHPLDISMDVAMQSVIAIGKSSHILFEHLVEPLSSLDSKSPQNKSQKSSTKSLSKKSTPKKTPSKKQSSKKRSTSKKRIKK